MCNAPIELWGSSKELKLSLIVEAIEEQGTLDMTIDSKCMVNITLERILKY
jgi:hypothetical protein